MKNSLSCRKLAESRDMEDDDDNGLELSLGLSCRGLSGKAKDHKSCNASDTHRAEGDDAGSNMISQTQEPSSSSHRIEFCMDKSPHNFFSDLAKASSDDAEASKKPFMVEDKTPKDKRKFSFQETDGEKKKKGMDADLHEKKTRTSRVSIAADEASTAENEDIAESEGGGTCDAAKEARTAAAPLPLNPLTYITSSPAGLLRPVSSRQVPALFGYSAVQLPMLDRDGSVIAKGGEDEGSARGVTSTGNGDSASLSLDLISAIKPGIAADVKFGGSGSRPNLPWVSTTGSGPHGRTISGVTYRYNMSQIKIVCACHGSHMSPQEFVRHASEENVTPPEESSMGLTTAASART